MKSASHSVALLGSGGVGKTAITQAVCRDEDIVEIFEDGILWATLGGQSNVPKALTAILTALTGESVAIDDVADAAQKLAAALVGRRCLIVFDDLAESAPVQGLLRPEADSRILITTRFRNLAAEIGAAIIEIRPLLPTDAQALLMSGLEDKLQEYGAVMELAALLGYTPLALTIANRLLRTRVEMAEAAEGVVDRLIEELHRDGLEALDFDADPVSGRSLFGVLSSALERLDSTERGRLPLMAKLPTDTPVTLQQAAEVLDMQIPDVERLIRRLTGMSVIEAIPGSPSFKVPAIANEYFRSLGRRQRRDRSTRLVSRSSSKVFVSYRREDSSYAARIYDRLSQEFGLEQIFMDVESIAPGEDFRAAINEQLAKSSVFIVLIGTQWVERTREEHDFVRMELESALRANIPIIPVLIGNADFPALSLLPPEIAALGRRQALKISNVQFHQDVDKLVEVVGRFDGKNPLPVLPAPPMMAAPMARAARTSNRAAMFRWIALAVLLVWAVVELILHVLPSRESAPSPVMSVKPVSPDPRAQELFDQAEALAYGRSVTPDYAEAIRLYRQSADLGFSPAMNGLGRMYELGRGVSRDTQQAAAWYQRAADLGNVDAKAALRGLAR